MTRPARQLTFCETCQAWWALTRKECPRCHGKVELRDFPPRREREAVRLDTNADEAPHVAGARFNWDTGYLTKPAYRILKGK